MKPFSFPILTSVITCVFLIPTPAFSSWSLTSPFSLTIPSAFLDKQVSNLIDKTSGLNFSIPDQTIESVVTTKLSQISLSIQDAIFQSTVIQSGRSWKLDLSSAGGTLNIGSINASQTVDKVISGVHVSVSFSGQCSNIALTLPKGAAHISSAVLLSVANDQAIVSLSNFQISWIPNAWQVSSIKCTGAQGFGEVVTQYLNAYLAQPSNLQQLVGTYLQLELNKLISQSVRSLFNGIDLNTHRSDITVAMKSRSLAQTARGYVMNGTATVTLPLANPGETLSETAAPLPSIIDAGTATSASIAIPDSVVTSLIGHLHQTQLVNQTFLSTQISSINSFLHSSFEKFFVFPDLRKFSKETVMHFQTTMPLPAASSLSEAAPETAAEHAQLQLDLHLGLSIQMQVPQASHYVPYVNILVPVQTHAVIQLIDGNVQVQLSNVNLKLKSTWDSQYVGKYKPNKFIWLSLLNGKIKSALDAQPLSWSLPVLNAGLNQSYHATAMLHDVKAKAINIFIDSN